MAANQREGIATTQPFHPDNYPGRIRKHTQLRLPIGRKTDPLAAFWLASKDADGSNELDSYAKMIVHKVQCGLCTRTLNKMDSHMGIPIQLHPVDIMQEERDRASAESLAANERAKVAADGSSSSGANEKNNNVNKTSSSEETYSPIVNIAAPNLNSAWVAQSRNPAARKRLRAKLLPGGYYLCIHCRNCLDHVIGDLYWQNGDKNDKGEEVWYHLTNRFKRGALSIWQYNYSLGRFVDKDGTKHQFSERIVLPFVPAHEKSANNEVFLQQMELICALPPGTLPRSAFGSTPNLANLPKPFMRVLSMLLRSSLEQLYKVGLTGDESEFGYALSNFNIFYYILADWTQSRPALRLAIMQRLQQWSRNPFAPEMRGIFDHWYDPIILGVMMGYGTRSFAGATGMKLLLQMMFNSDPTGEGIQTKDAPTYLRQLYNEGRNRKIIVQHLLLQSLVGTIGTPSEAVISKIGATYGLPDHTQTVNLMKELQSATSITGFQSDGERPGFWVLLGMQGDVDPRVEQQLIISSWTSLTRQVAKLYNTNVPLPHSAELEKLQQVRVEPAVERMAIAKIQREQAIKEERERHTGMPTAREHGQPRLSHHVCRYTACGKTFSSSGALFSHLCSAGVNPSSFYHVDHERYIIRIQSSKSNSSSSDSASNLIELKGDICPVCARHGDVRDHFIELGIAPIWTPEAWEEWNTRVNLSKLQVDQPQAEEHKEESSSSSLPVARQAAAGDCVICMDHKIDTVIVPCMHAAGCQGCMDIWNKSCPVCKGAVNFLMPLDLVTEDGAAPDLKIFFVNDEE